VEFTVLTAHFKPPCCLDSIESKGTQSEERRKQENTTKINETDIAKITRCSKF
jgi:hypothetical protein